MRLTTTRYPLRAPEIAAAAEFYNVDGDTYGNLIAGTFVRMDDVMSGNTTDREGGPPGWWYTNGSAHSFVKMYVTGCLSLQMIVYSAVAVPGANDPAGEVIVAEDLGSTTARSTSGNGGARRDKVQGRKHKCVCM